MDHFDSKGPRFEYSRITEYIYAGTNQCCQTHFSKELLKKGVHADISLEAVKLDQPFGVRFYLWLPTRNHAPPSQNQLAMGAWSIKWLVDHHVKVYIHCRNGHGRTSTLIGAYLVMQGKTPEQAVKFIKSKRPGAHLTPGQFQALHKFQKLQKNLGSLR